MRDSNTQPSDLESDVLPLRHGVQRVTKTLQDVLSFTIQLQGDL